MNIAYLFTTFPCRSETFAQREIEQLVKLGFNITIFAAQGQRIPSQCSRENKVVYRPWLFSVSSFLSVVYIFFKYPLGIIKFIYLIFKLLLINLTEAKQLLLNFHMIAYWIRILDKKSISHIHAYFLSWPACIAMAIGVITKKKFSIAGHARDLFVERGAIGLKLSYASWFVVCSQYSLGYLKRILPQKFHDNLFLSYLCMNLSKFMSNEHLKQIYCEPATCKILAVGRLVPKKGFQYLLEAFALVHQKQPECKLLIAGDGPQRDHLIGLAKELSIASSVKFLGWQEHRVLNELMRSSTILVAPSVIASDGDKDGIPNVILEAFACGLAVIASKIAGITEAVIHGKTGLLIDPSNVNDFANTVYSFLINSDLRQKCSLNATHYVKEKFDIKKNIKPLADLFSGLR